MFVSQSDHDQLSSRVDKLQQDHSDTVFELTKTQLKATENRGLIDKLLSHADNHSKELVEYKTEMGVMNATLTNICENTKKMADATDFINNQRNAWSTFRNNLLWMASVLTASGVILTAIMYMNSYLNQLG